MCAYLISLDFLNLLIYLVFRDIGLIRSLALLCIRNGKRQSGGDGGTSQNARPGHIERGRSRGHDPIRCGVIVMSLCCKVSSRLSD